MAWTRIYSIWEMVRSSFWFIPGIMILTSVLISIVTLEIDHRYQYDLLVQALYIRDGSLFDNFLTVGPEGARAVLTTVAGSMINVAGVTFSVTIVALTLAASQFGSRLLRNFMQDRSTQVVLGSFNSTFVFCLLILRSIQTGENDVFVPSISVNLAVVFAITNVFILIFFIHHIAVSLKVESVINSVYCGLKLDVDRIFSEVTRVGNKGSGKVQWNGCDDHDERYVLESGLQGADDGYILAIDYEKLITLGTERDLIITLHHRPGDFVVKGCRLATIKSAANLEEGLQQLAGAAFVYGKQRTPEQDVEYAIHQLVEVAVRALSPGINDPFTAIACVDYLSAIICSLARKQFPRARCADSNGNLRLILCPVGFGDLLDSAFNQIRQHSSSSVAVTIHLMESYGRIADRLEDARQKRELIRHVRMLWRASEYTLQEKRDMADIRKRYRHCLTKLGGVEEIEEQ